MDLRKCFVITASVVLAIFINGCQGEEDSFSEEPLLDTISVEFGNYEVLASDLISEYEMVYLDSKDLLVGSVSRLYVNDSLIVVADITRSRVFCFDRSGQMKFYIDKLGYGPEEYSQMKDVGVNFLDETIEVLALPSQAVVRYDLNTGEFLDQVKYKFWTSTFSPLQSGGRLFHHGTMPNYDIATKGDSLDAGVYVTDSENNIKRTYINRIDYGLDRIRHVTLRNAYPDYQSGVNYVPLYQNTIYKATAEGLIPMYNLDFGSNTSPKDFLLTFNGHYREFPKFLRNSGYANYISDFYESSTHITFTFHSHRGYQKAVYDKQTGKSKAYRKFNRDNALINVLPKGVYADYHISVASFESLDLRKRFFERAMPEEKRAENPEYQRLKSALDNNHGQNPILVFTKFKPIE